MPWIKIAILLFVFTTVSAQEGRSLKIRLPESNVRAVIVGISDYEDNDIPDLRYAHKDAESFANYLRSEAGGNVTEDNIKVLLNENATGGNIHKALYWLVKESKANDQCIIYFSGHGDVETIYEDEPGHFLVYDSPSSIYQINSLRINDLERIVSTLSNKNEAQVTVITDACRAGKLAGSDVKGSQATAAALANQFANEIKVMSCQANEYSIEGEQWGEGRGIFSYHLIDGLIGLADENKDTDVSLKELSRYLEDRFDEDLVDVQQTPVIVGDRSSVIANVHEASMQELLLQKFGKPVAEEEASILGMASRTVEDDALALFYAALANKILLDEDVKDELEPKSAMHYFKLIEQDEAYADKAPIAKGDLISALKDDAQSAINRYLDLDATEMKKRWFEGGAQFFKFANYLKNAAKLLGEDHYLYGQVKAKEIYFDVVGKRIDLDNAYANANDYFGLDSLLNDALKFEPRSPFINNELGLIFIRSQEYEKAKDQFIKATEISPKWAMPFNNLCLAYLKMKEYDKSIEAGTKAIELNKALVSPYTNLAKASSKLKNYQEAIDYDKKFLEGVDFSCEALSNIGYRYYKLDSLDQGIQFYKETIECIKTNDSNKKDLLRRTYKLTANAYQVKEDFRNAIKFYQLELELEPTSVSRINLGSVYNDLEQFENAIKQFDFIIEHDVEVANKYSIVYVQNAIAHGANNDLKGFEKNLIKAIEHSAIDKKEIETMEEFAPIRNSEEYKNILTRF